MENENDKLDKYTKDKIEKGIENFQNEKDLKIKWRKELEENQSIMNYLDGFDNNSIPPFIDQYLNLKYSWYKHGDFFGKIEDEKREKWIHEAHEHLEVILQKKLFDMQCQWRAGQIKIDEIDICLDFKIWQSKIFNCPFLEPITETEIELYQSYLASSDAEYNYGRLGYDWQEYENFKATDAADDDIIDLPEWYLYHNNMTGNSSLLLLPDYKGEKEFFYRKIVSQEYKKKHPEKYIPIEPNENLKPYIHSFDEEKIDFFVSTFENEEIRKKYEKFKNGLSKSRKNHPFEMDIVFQFIVNSDEPIPVESNVDIKQAMEKAYSDFCLKKISEHLPMAHQQYLFNINMGFKMSEKEDEDKIFEKFRPEYIKKILEGRALNGEEQNFDY